MFSQIQSGDHPHLLCLQSGGEKEDVRQEQDLFLHASPGKKISLRSRYSDLVDTKMVIYIFLQIEITFFDKVHNVLCFHRVTVRLTIVYFVH